MPTFEKAAADADEAAQAMRGLAHATRRIEDPTEIYTALGAVSEAVASLSQALHQMGTFHDHHGAHESSAVSDPRQLGAAYRVSWDLHRAAEMLNSIRKSIDSAHEAEGKLTYQPPRLAAQTPSHGAKGLSF